MSEPSNSDKTDRDDGNEKSVPRGPSGSSDIPPEKINELVTQAQAGDEQAFGILYKNFVSPIYRYIFFNVKNRNDAEDLTQTVFLRAFKAVGDYVSRGVPFGAWLYAIARNATIDYWKKKRDVLVDNPDEVFERVVETGESAEESTGALKRAIYIQKLLATLSREQQEIVSLYFIEELSHQEISEITGKSEEAVRALKHRALKALRGKIDERYL